MMIAIVHTHAESILTITIIVENWTKNQSKDDPRDCVND